MNYKKELLVYGWKVGKIFMKDKQLYLRRNPEKGKEKMIITYGICSVLSIIIYMWFYITDVKKSLCQNVMILIMTLSNLGYLSLAVSDNLSSAILSTKIGYLGGCFLSLLYLFTVCEICHIELQKKLKVLLIILQMAVFSLICSVGFSTLYYKNVQFVVKNGVGYLVKEYGPLHFVYPVLLGAYLVIAMIIAIWSGLKKKTVNHKEVRNMIICAGIAVLCYAVYRVLHMEIDCIAFAYIILMLGALIPIYHSNLFTVNENKDIIREQFSKVGFISFNKRLEFMGANDFALDIFKELEDCEVGRNLVGAGKELSEILLNVENFQSVLQEKENTGYNHTKYNTLIKDNRFFDMELHTVDDYKGRCVGYTVEIRDETEHYHMLELTEKYNEELTKEVNQKTERIQTIQEKTILGMAQMVESRDLSTGGHIKRTSDVVKIFSRKLLEADLGLDKHFLKLVTRSAPMHDLGKIGVDDAILRKQGRFSDEEYEQMKKHAEIGGEMVRDILTGVEEDEFVQVAYNVANFHHEKVDGKGYQMGLKGKEIPIEARIMALADVFDALVSKRCYKDAFSFDKAFSIIEENAGTHFDYDLAMVFLQCRSELEEYYNNCTDT